MANARILIVEDEIIIARELETRLLGLGYEIVGIASSGEEAITLTEKTQPELVLMDIMLKGEMDGIETAAKIRHQFSLPVIYLTAYADPATLLQASITEPYGYILKPFNERELHANIEMALYKHRAETKMRLIEETCARLRGFEGFSYLASHDLRAPLRGIESLVDILLEDYAPHLPAEAQKYLNLMRNRADQMDHLIEDLLAFARLSYQDLKKQPVAMIDLVKTTLDSLQAEQEGRKVEIKIGDLPVCPADPALLRQVFMNLLSNALKYSRSRELASIEVGCRQGPNNESVFFVKDNGIGFDPQYAERIFNVFERLHPADEYEGSGVGLAVVQRIVERHGGRVWAEPDDHAGATFFFTLSGSTTKG